MTRRPGSPQPAVPDAAVMLGRALRDSGVPASLDGELAFCRSLEHVDISDRDAVRWAARSCLVHDPAHIPAFEAIFGRFWLGMELMPQGRGSEHGESDPRMSGPQQGGESFPQHRPGGRSGTLLGGGMSRASREVPVSAANRQGEGERCGALAAYSPTDLQTERRRLDFERGEIEAVRRLAGELREALPRRRSRRARESGHGRLDVRRTLRRSMRTEGEALRVAYSAPSQRPRRLLVICDVSGSMDRYSRVLLAVLRATVAASRSAEAFCFATRLTRLTRHLSQGTAERALERARGCVADWSGGTRIGDVLADFNRLWGARGIARGAIVIVISDGWDRGDPQQLARQLARLRLQSRRLVWINPRPAPLAGQPLAVGMRAALPHVDEFVPGHDPRSLAALPELVRGLGPGRPARPWSARGVDSVEPSPPTVGGG